MTTTVKGVLQKLDSAFSIEWKVDQFFADCQKVGDCYKSPLFPIKYQNHILNWNVKVYPKDTDGENKNHVSLYLSLVCESEVELIVHYAISLLSEYKGQYTRYDATDIFSSPSFSRGWHRFEPQDVTKDPKNNILIDDSLTILCDVTLHSLDQNDTESFHVYGEWLDKIEIRLGNYEALFEHSNFADVTFNVQDKKIELHKAVLSCQNPVFKAMFNHDMKENAQNIVEITDVDYEVMQELFRFMYSGKVKNIEKIASLLLIAADKYQVVELKALCEKTLYDELAVDNVVEYLKLTEVCDTIHLKRLVIQFIATHHKDVIKKSGFPNLHSDILYQILLAISEKNSTSPMSERNCDLPVFTLSP